MTGKPEGASEPIGTTALARSYGIPFSEVWDAATSVVGSLRGWETLATDSREGTIQVMTANPFGYRPLEAALRLWLDDLGQTRLEIRFSGGRHPLLPPASSTRGRRFLRRMDRALGLSWRG